MAKCETWETTGWGYMLGNTSQHVSGHRSPEGFTSVRASSAKDHSLHSTSCPTQRRLIKGSCIRRNWSMLQRTGCGTCAHFSFRNTYMGPQHITKHRKMISKWKHWVQTGAYEGQLCYINTNLSALLSRWTEKIKAQGRKSKTKIEVEQTHTFLWHLQICS